MYGAREFPLTVDHDWLLITIRKIVFTADVWAWAPVLQEKTCAAKNTPNRSILFSLTLKCEACMGQSFPVTITLSDEAF